MLSITPKACISDCKLHQIGPKTAVGFALVTENKGLYRVGIMLAFNRLLREATNTDNNLRNTMNDTEFDLSLFLIEVALKPSYDTSALFEHYDATSSAEYPEIENLYPSPV